MEGIEDWEKESKLQKAREDIFMVTLKDIMEYYKDKEGQWTAGVEGLSSRGRPAGVSGKGSAGWK